MEHLDTTKCKSAGCSNTDPLGVDSCNQWTRYVTFPPAVIEDLHIPGTKADAGKPQPSLIHEGFATALGLLTDVATMGANKYTKNGWKDVPNAESRYTDAMLRHLNAHFSGEARDQESDLPHLAHAVWNMMALLELGGIELGGKTGLLKHGKPWGTLDKSNGYYVVHYLGKKRYVHHIVWEMVNGTIPSGITIDHIDQDKTNNSPDNLRLVDMSQQMQNTGLYSTNVGQQPQYMARSNSY